MRHLSLLVVVALIAVGGIAAGSDDNGPDKSNCDTAFIFDPSQEPDPVFDAMEAADVVPVEVRFDYRSHPEGMTGGGLTGGDDTSVAKLREMFETSVAAEGVDAVIIGIRVRGNIETETLGELSDEVHTRMLIPIGSSAALSAPGVGEGDAVNVVGGGTCA
jgi:hypothetical protein